MTDKTRRSLRTAFAGLLAVASALPVLIPVLGLAVGPYAAIAGTLVAVATAFTALINTPAVDALLPAWLKRDAPEDV